ncbi:MAG: hypothetical protein H6832_11450 [Planctomycetes bacterium]|nr:hypothetical protein [Planctomycetota bacterium]MCB9919006.1 hypothetical protein [Planctomycetota bacterium]
MVAPTAPSSSSSDIAEPPPHREPLLASMAGLAAALCAEGSIGLFGYPLLRALSWCLLAVVLVGGVAWRRTGPRNLAWIAAGSLLGFFATSSIVPAARVAGIALVVAATASATPKSRLLRQVTIAILIFAIYSFAIRAIPTLWHLADTISGLLGTIAGHAGSLVGKLSSVEEWPAALASGPEPPLVVGTTFAGFDMLVLFGTLLAVRYPKRLEVLGLGLITLFGIHFVLLGVLTLSPALWHAFAHERGAIQTWQFPVLFVFADGVAMAALVRFVRPSEIVAYEVVSRKPILLTIGAALLAAITPAFLTLPLGRCSLVGKRVVASDNVYGNWERPKHGDYGRLSIGMYGMLETFVKSLGGTFTHEKELTDEVLAQTDVLMLMYPHEDWLPGELQRIHDYVRNGGALVIFGEHTIREKDGKARFNDVLSITDMVVPFDAALFQVGGWLQSYDPHVHPITSGISQDRNAFGVVTGASVTTHWPARPLLLGRWGFNDLGDEAGNAMLGDHAYNPGERLGDVVLIAEQEVGDGIVIAFGDTSSVTNGITMGVHDFNARLLGYLAARPSSPKAMWRQFLGSLLLVGLGFVLFRSGCTGHIAAAGLFALSTIASDAWTYELGTMLPDGRQVSKPNDLAYFDTAHLGKYDDEAWRWDGTMGFRMTLNRNGYQCLELHDFTRERLERAGLVMSIAPQREFSAKEREMVREFVNGGGTFIVTASYPDVRASKSLLRDFGFEVGRINEMPGREPQPMGHFKAPYWPFEDGTFAFVRFHEAWPVADIAAPTATPARILSYGTGNYPVILQRDFGKGHFIVIGDSSFVHNKNLEYEGGQLIEGKRENADFWRWLLGNIRNEPWHPENPTASEGGK